MKFPFLKPLAAVAFAAMLTTAFAAAPSAQPAKPSNSSSNAFAIQLPTKGNEWRSAKHQQNPFVQRNQPKRIVNKSDNAIGPVNSFGTLYAPNGTEWVYTASYDYDTQKGYTAAHLKIYDENNKLIGSIDDKFELAEHQTSVNEVMINPNVTQKFFNVNDKYEVIIFIHATTDDYAGYYYQHVFTLAKDQTEPLLTIPGNEVLMVDMATDSWSEKKQMVMMREELDEDNNYFIHYDIYDRASYSSMNAPVLLHTFTFDYQNISGSGNYELPIAIQNINGKAHYAVSYYEKPYFDPSVPIFQEPVVLPDNNFIIELYTADGFKVAEGEKAQPYKTVKIPMETEEGYLYTYPRLGSFMGNEDFSVGLFDDTNDPYFVITNDNYVTSTDEFIASIYLYDQNGNKVKTIATGVSDYLILTDIEGEDLQFCTVDSENGKYQFHNLPSGDIVAEIPFEIDGYKLSMSLDRIPAAGNYNYVIASNNADLDEKDNILHPIGYFNADGTLSHWDRVNLGPDVVMAQPAILSNWLNPYLFDADSDMDYMFLVKIPTNYGVSSKTEEHLWILNTEGEKLADFGPLDSDGILSTISILNAKTNNPKLLSVYHNWESDATTLHFNNLPFARFTAGGKGTAADPYLISSPGDLMQIANFPSAHYKIVNDIDCGYYPFSGINAEFEGTIDGQNHTIKNLAISGSSWLGAIIGGAVVENINFEAPTIYPHGESCGLIASMAVYDGTNVPQLKNIHISQAAVSDDNFSELFGTIIGQLTTGSILSGCSVSNTDIYLPNATVGGIVGDVNSSGATISAVAFSGEVNAKVAGGVIGTVSAVTLKDAHVSGDIIGSRTAGGIAGEVDEYQSNRGTFTNCYVEGTITSTNPTDASAGGIVGSIAAGDNKCVTNNVVALTAVNFNAGATTKSAHRIVGHTCADEPGQVLWEDPWWEEFQGDPYQHQELWPRAAVAPDAGFENNFALSTLAPVNGDEAMAADASSVEGKTIEVNAFTEYFLTSHGFLFGNTETSPWTLSNNRLVLWFEKDSPTGIQLAASPNKGMLQMHNGLITANGPIEVYTLAGTKATSADKALSISNLQPGIYIATCAGRSLKFIKK